MPFASSQKNSKEKLLVSVESNLWLWLSVWLSTEEGIQHTLGVPGVPDPLRGKGFAVGWDAEGVSVTWLQARVVVPRAHGMHEHCSLFVAMTPRRP